MTLDILHKTCGESKLSSLQSIPERRFLKEAMPYIITQEKHGLLTEWWGDASTLELIQMQERLHAHPDFKIMHYSLHDLTNCARFTSKEDESVYSAAIDGAASITNAKLRIAIVGANLEVLGAVNAYIDSGLSQFPLRIFSSMDEARAWVSQPH